MLRDLTDERVKAAILADAQRAAELSHARRIRAAGRRLQSAAN